MGAKQYLLKEDMTRMRIHYERNARYNYHFYMRISLRESPPEDHPACPLKFFEHLFILNKRLGRTIG